MRKNLFDVVAKQINTLPNLDLQTVIAADVKANLYRITASHGKTTKPLSDVDYANMITNTLDSRFTLLADTLEDLGDYNHSHVFSALIIANTISIKASASEDLNGFRVVEANVFLDNEDKIWRMVGEGEGRRLVLSEKEDLSALLNARITRKSTAIVASSAIHYMGMPVNRGDYIMYYNTTASDYSFGFAVVSEGNVVVADRKLGKIATISPAQVIASVMNDSMPKEIVDTQRSAMMLALETVTDNEFSAPMANTYVDYLSKLYKGTEFFKHWEELIQNRRKVGSDNLPLTTMRP